MKNLKNLLLTTICALALFLIPVALSVPAKAAGTDGYIPYTGSDVTFIKEDGSPFGMFAPQPGTWITVKDENVVIHYVPKSASTYGWIHWGMITDTLTKDLPANEDGSFTITLPKTACGFAVPVAPIKTKDDGTTSTQYYLAIPSEEEITGGTLAVTNNIKMFKVNNAVIRKDNDGNSYVLVELNGSGYNNLFKGDYDEAAANGDNRENWIAGYKNINDKLEFKIPLTADEIAVSALYMPVISISNTYLEQYDQKTGPLERAFFPRGFEFNFADKTLTVSNYDYAYTLNSANTVKDFNVDNAYLRTIGGPNNMDGYTVNLGLIMADENCDAVFIGEADQAAADGAQIINLTDLESAQGKEFVIPVEYQAETGKVESIVSFFDKEFIISYRVKDTGTWQEAKVTVSKTDGKVDIKPAVEEPKTPAFKITNKAKYTVKRGKSVKLTVSKPSDDKGKVTFTKVAKGSNKQLVIKSGKIVVKKNAKKGKTYTINVKASIAATADYTAATATKKIKIKVK